MKRAFVFKSVLLFIILSIFSHLAFFSPVFAQNNGKKVEVTTLQKDETLNEDYLAANEKVEVLGNVNGDVFVAGGQIIIEGDIEGDVFAAGGNIEITGNISENVYVVGGNLIIDGEIGGDAISIGGNITYSARSKIGGDINAAGGNISVASPVAKDIRVGGGNLTLSNTVGGDVLAGVGALRLSRGASILKGITYSSPEKASIAGDASISGKINYIVPKDEKFDKKAAGIGGIIALTLASALTAFVVGFILLHFFPRILLNGVNEINTNTLKTFLSGLAFVVIVPILIFLLFITLIGIPLALICLILYVLVLYLSKLFIIFFVGEKIMEKTNRKTGPILTFVVGLIAYYVATLIPIMGFLVLLLAPIFGSGAIISLFQKRNVRSERVGSQAKRARN